MRRQVTDRRRFGIEREKDRYAKRERVKGRNNLVVVKIKKKQT